VVESGSGVVGIESYWLGTLESAITRIISVLM